jgi:hypothetical protein
MLFAPSLTAQSVARLAQEARFYKAPRGQLLGTFLAGATVIPGRTSGSAVEVTVDGWILARSLGPFNRDGFNTTVTRRPSEELRDSPTGTVIARVSSGAGFVKTDARGEWTRVRRTVWVAKRVLDSAEEKSAAESPTGPERVQLAHRAGLSVAPGGETIGGVDSGAGARLLARSGGWSRIQLEAWVPDSALAVAPAGVIIGLSQAEVRANPARYIGQVVEWRLQFVAVQKADELRPEIPEGAPYLLTRGPLPEPGFVYVIVPRDQLAQFEALPALTELIVRGTIRSPTTKYLPTPVLDLVAVMGQ